jgi:hypothetical protein
VEIAVRFAEIAADPAGIPHTPVAKNRRPDRGPIAGPPRLPFGFRVSSTRHGASVLRPPQLAATKMFADEPFEQPPAVTVTATVVVPAAETLKMTDGVPCPETSVPFVTDHVYVAPAPALGTEADPVVEFGMQRLGGAVIAADGPLTTAAVAAAGPVQPFTVAVTEYVPDAAGATFAIEGFWRLDAKPLGPVHAYVAPAIDAAVRCNAPPAQSGPSLPAAGAAGIAFMVALVLAAVEQPFTVAVTAYVPDAAGVAFGIDGFWADEVKPFGPVHAYVAPAIDAAVSASVWPAHRGALLPAVGTGGGARMATGVALVEFGWPETVRTTE